MALYKKGDFYQADNVDMDQDLIHCKSCATELTILNNLPDIYCHNCGITTKRSDINISYNKEEVKH